MGWEEDEDQGESESGALIKREQSARRLKPKDSHRSYKITAGLRLQKESRKHEPEAGRQTLQAREHVATNPDSLPLQTCF